MVYGIGIPIPYTVGIPKGLFIVGLFCDQGTSWNIHKSITSSREEIETERDCILRRQVRLVSVWL